MNGKNSNFKVRIMLLNMKICTISMLHIPGDARESWISNSLIKLFVNSTALLLR